MTRSTTREPNSPPQDLLIAQRGEVEMAVWLAKVAEIRERYPMPSGID